MPEGGFTTPVYLTTSTLIRTGRTYVYSVLVSVSDTSATGAAVLHDGTSTASGTIAVVRIGTSINSERSIQANWNGLYFNTGLYVQVLVGTPHVTIEYQ